MDPRLAVIVSKCPRLKKRVQIYWEMPKKSLSATTKGTIEGNNRRFLSIHLTQVCVCVCGGGGTRIFALNVEVDGRFATPRGGTRGRSTQGHGSEGLRV